ncbi:DUF5689 domain-containing protein [uncultured Lacinutrix sp.]|uniref:DUF5689 domain-containing protein n=1 Tax=uncultured Lacinutrix sp. TaxID=574032 RepID=UPI00262AAB99|nr:DUF5689 domain-containing protein [uncultured Lacinutrix sp.]
MSKTNKFLALALGLVTMLFLNSCVEDDDYTVPEVLVPAVDISTLGTKTTFAAVASRFADAQADGDDVGTWEFDAPLYIEGYVISSDAAGNFFEEIIIQNTTDENDLAGDPRKGIKVEINVRDLSNFYNYGRKVYVKLNGLAVGESNGVLTLGKANGTSLGQLEPFEYQDFVIRDQEVATISPKMVAIADLSEDDENTLIQISDAQFIKGAIEATNTYAGESTDQFDGFRTIENCETGSTISLQTSTFADFKSFPLAGGRGTIEGIYSRDFGDDFSVLIVNDTNAINFSNTDRCDPIVLECTDPVSTAVTIFNEDFQSITNEAQLDALGWTNINVSGGSERYEDNSFSGDTYMKISAFGTGENPLEAWLVTPAINLDGSTNEELSFEVSSNFETGKILTAFITENFTGDVTTTEWIELEANIPIGDSGFGDFVASNINISCLNGDVHVAFKYLGAAGGAETRYHIDDIKVTGM